MTNLRRAHHDPVHGQPPGGQPHGRCRGGWRNTDEVTSGWFVFADDSERISQRGGCFFFFLTLVSHSAGRQMKSSGSRACRRWMKGWRGNMEEWRDDPVILLYSPSVHLSVHSSPSLVYLSQVSFSFPQPFAPLSVHFLSVYFSSFSFCPFMCSSALL